MIPFPTERLDAILARHDIVTAQLASGEIVAAGGEEWYVPIEIHVFRPKLRLAKAAEAFWQHIVKGGRQA